MMDANEAFLDIDTGSKTRMYCRSEHGQRHGLQLQKVFVSWHLFLHREQKQFLILGYPSLQEVFLIRRKC